MKNASRLLAVVAVSLLAVGDAGACSCTKESLTWYFNSASAALEGYPTVIRLDQRPAGTEGATANKIVSRTLVEFHVNKWWKGGSGETVVLATGMGGGDCGGEFRVGLRYIVFATAGGDHLETSLCSGNLYFDNSKPEAAELDRLATKKTEPK
jgi:hypothetical protein